MKLPVSLWYYYTIISINVKRKWRFIMKNSYTTALRRPSVAEVTVKDRFWTPYLEKIRHKTLPYVLDKFEEIGYVDNFRIVAGLKEGEFKGPPFSDGLLLETMRGASDLLAAEYDAALDARLDALIEIIAAASDADPDGFVCTKTILLYPHQRWGENGGDIIVAHDLYDHGALVEAGVHHYLATGKTTLLRPAVRAANYICRVIPPLGIVPGHSLPEEAFVKLHCLFRDHRELDTFAAEHSVDADAYLRMAEFWYDARGKKPGSPLPRFQMSYNQNHAPFADQREALGHAVRATLCYTGASAVVREAGREDYLHALHALWDSITKRKMHISGGVGTRHDIEGFDVDYSLPNNAYLETCAGIGLAFFGAEFGLIAPSSERFDVFERALCNNVLAAIGEDGQHYFYQNPLISDGSIRRWEWHGCPCCPPMLLKLYGALGTFAYAYSDDALYVNLYIGSECKTERFTVSQADGSIIVDTKGKPMKLYLRIPEYAEHFALTLDGKKAEYTIENGYAVLDVTRGTIAVTFDAPPRRIAANYAAEADRGLVAVMRGPWLLCAEEIDNPGGVDFTVAEDAALLAYGDGAVGRCADGGEFKLIPYYRWCSRENSGRMQVWFKQEKMKDMEKMEGELYYDYEKIQ